MEYLEGHDDDDDGSANKDGGYKQHENFYVCSTWW